MAGPAKKTTGAARGSSPVRPAWQLAYDENAPLPPCPFTGKELTEFRPKDQYGSELFGARGDFFTTRLFPTRRQLVYWLAHRNGFPPGYDASALTAVRERTEPEANPFQDVVDKHKVIDETAKQLVTENAKNLNLRT